MSVNCAANAFCMCPCRTMYGVPLTISDSQLMIPQPEWDAVANEARQAPSFALQLQGMSTGSTVNDVIFALIWHGHLMFLQGC